MAVESGSSAAAANPTATLVNATVLHGATASSCRVSGCGLDASHHRNDLSPLGPYGKAAGPCHRSVEEQSIALSAAVRERGRHAMQASLGGAYVHGEGAGSIELVREGNGWPLTHVWRVENSASGSSFSSPCVWLVSVAVR